MGAWTRCAGGWHPCGWCGVAVRGPYAFCCHRCEIWLYAYMIRRAHPTANYMELPTPMHLHGRPVLRVVKVR